MSSLLHRSTRRDETGAATVEFALVSVLLVGLLMGMIEFSRAYNAQLALQHSVREGVRVWATAQTDADVLQKTKDVTKNAALPTVTLVDANINPGPEGCVPGLPTSVIATYQFTFNTPMVGTTLDLSATGVMRCGG